MNHKKSFWITGSILLAVLIIGLLAQLGSGMVDIIKAHLGI